jgi:hypothetical protein
MIDLDSPGTMKQVARRISTDIDEYCVRKWDEGPRSHLGASVIGHNCSYYLSLSFRWAFYKVHEAVQYRLFQRGHFEEPRFINYLTGMGCNVKSFDKVLLFHAESDAYYYGPEEDCTEGYVQCVEDIPTHEIEAAKRGITLDKGKRQIRISACKGHFGGSTDGQVILPERYGIPEWILLELKTQGIGKKGKNFIELTEKGMKIKKAQHFAQCSIYGYKLGLKYVLYIAVNKNTDELHIEVVKLDPFLGEALERKAEMIIFGATPPAKLSMSPAYFECSYCDAKEYCHLGKPVDKNCRSCKNSLAIEDACWYCTQYQQTIPKEFIKDGCGEWISYF